MAAISRAPAGRGQGRSRVPLRSGTRGELRALGTELERAAGSGGGVLRASEGEPRGSIQRSQGPGNAGSVRCQEPGNAGSGRCQGPGNAGSGRCQEPGNAGSGRCQGPGNAGSGRCQGPGNAGSVRCQGPGNAGSVRCQGPGNAGSGRVAQSAPGSASHTRLKSVLNKVAQLESKILGQKKHVELRSAGSGVKASAEERSSSSSSAGSERGGGAGDRRCWKDRGGKGRSRDRPSEEEESFRRPERNGTVQQRLDLDSDEEEMRELMESSLGFSSGNGNQKVLSKTPVLSGAPPREEVSPAEPSEESSCHNRVSESSESGRVNSPAPSASSRKLPGCATKDQVLSSPTENTPGKIPLPKASCSKQIQECLESDRSEIKSLDELFSEGADAEDPTSSSLKSFRLNILSLDDLAPDPASEAAELKQKGKAILFAQDWDKSVSKDLLEEEQAAVTITSAATAVGDSSAEELEECISEAEISEHLSGLSSDFPPYKQDSLHQEERTLNCEYSEDFESSGSAAAREAAGGEPCRGLRDCAAPTGEPRPSCCWDQGSSSTDPLPFARAVLSVDALEALSARSPSALLLHSLCQQHLLLTQQFLHGARHLHSALVEALEQERFHYHSLEEAKEYIKNHRPPPLTLEQALEEVRRAQES